MAGYTNPVGGILRKYTGQLITGYRPASSASAGQVYAYFDTYSGLPPIFRRSGKRAEVLVRINWDFIEDPELQNENGDPLLVLKWGSFAHTDGDINTQILYVPIDLEKSLFIWGLLTNGGLEYINDGIITKLYTGTQYSGGEFDTAPVDFTGVGTYLISVTRQDATNYYALPEGFGGASFDVVSPSDYPNTAPSKIYVFAEEGKASFFKQLFGADSDYLFGSESENSNSLEIVKGIIEGQAINYKVQNVTSNTRVESGCFSIEFRNTGRYNCMIDEKVLKPNEVWKLEAFNERLKIGNNFNIIFEDEQTIDLTKTSSKI